MNTVLAMPDYLPDFPITPNSKILLEKRYQRKDANGKVYETVNELFWRVASNVAVQDTKYGASDADVTQLAITFYKMMCDQLFLPNSPTLMNAGKPDGQLSACFVLPVEDSIPGIFDAIKHAAIIHKTGGGTGFSFSRLRPKNSVVASTGGIASGPLSFLQIFNIATEQIKQGGTRRGANMGMLRIDHPDIEEFIRAKEKDGELSNFNLSVAVTQGFMEALQKNEQYPLIDPRTNEITEYKNAKEMWDLLVDRAWLSGDPGVVFIDNINADNPTPHLGDIEATNPCGEQPLLPYEACNLGSINLAKMCKDGQVDWVLLHRIVRLSVHFLDNVIDANCYPLPEIADNVLKTRKIGLGVMGFADMLYQLGIPYNSNNGVEMGRQIMKAIKEESHQASRELAEKRGAYPESKDGLMRNATVTTIAPTGSLSIMANCSSGIEPVFALSLTKNILGGEKMIEVNQHFQNKIQDMNLDTTAILNIVSEKGSVQGIGWLPEKVREVFITAMDMEPIWHLKMQAAFQKFTDNAVSKTINLPNSATREDIDFIYKEAWRSCCKGITVYRDGCKSLQVLNTGEGQRRMEGKQPVSDTEKQVKTRPSIMCGFTQRIETGLGTMYLTINEVDGKPFEVFATIGKSGHSTTAKAEAIGRLVSLALRSGISVKDVVAQIKGIGGEHPVFRKKGMILSIPDAIAWVLESHYLKDTQIASTRDISKPTCPECGEILVLQEGCCTCHSCGYSQCS